MDPPLPLASDPSSDLVDYFKLLTEFLPNNGTQHTTYKTDRAQGVRKLKTVKRWTRKEKLGEGTFGTVWREVERDGSERAVKAVSKSLCLRKGVDYKRELAAMAKLSRHEEIFANFHGWFEDSESVYLAMEYFKHGDLQTCMDEKIPEDQVKAITAQLLEGLKIMHENNFTHRDMKPQVCSLVFMLSRGAFTRKLYVANFLNAYAERLRRPKRALFLGKDWRSWHHQAHRQRPDLPQNRNWHSRVHGSRSARPHKPRD